MPLKSNFPILFFICLILLTPDIKGEKFPLDNNTTRILVDFEQCVSYFGGYNEDYSEFGYRLSSNIACNGLDLVSPNYVYRENTSVNTHSCTPGFDEEGIAMCISSLDECSFEANSDKALRFNIQIEPGIEGSARLEAIQFYDRAPEMFSFVDGATGLNNYPTQLGIRILKDSIEIFRDVNLGTSLDWRKVELSFNDNSDFFVTDTTVFSVEILPFCLAGISSAVTAWDIDELEIISSCSPLDGGLLKVIGDVDLCIQDSIQNIRLEVENNVGPEQRFIITTEDNAIVLLPNDPLVSFDTLPNGRYFAYSISYTEEILNLEIGNSLDSIEGCFDLSGRVLIYNNKLTGGRLLDFDGQSEAFICVDDTMNVELELTLTDFVGSFIQYVVVDSSNNIIQSTENAVIDLTGVLESAHSIYALVHNGQLENAAVGNSREDVSGCYSISLPFLIQGILQSGIVNVSATDICLTDDVQESVLVEVTDVTGGFQYLIFTDGDSLIYEVLNGSNIVIDNASPSTGFIWSVVSSDSIEFVEGELLTSIDGTCIAMSRSDLISYDYYNGGMLSFIDSTFSIDICVSDTIADVLEINSSGLSDGLYDYILTTENDSIIGIYDINSSFPSDSFGTCRIYGLAYDGNLSFVDSLFIDDLESLNECLSISSNFVTVNKLVDGEECGETECMVDGGFIDLFNSIYCVGDGEPDFVTGDIQGAIGDVSQLIVTDFDSIIISLPDTLFFDVDEAGGGICRVWHLSSMDSIVLDTGMHIDQINSMCFDLSTGAVFNRISNNGGEVSLPGGLTEIELCVSDSISDVLIFETTGNGVTYQYVITDTSNVIVALPDSASYDFEGSLAGVCRVWGLAHNSLFNSVVGDTLILPDSPGSCFDLSDNFIEVIKEDSLGVCMGTECIVDGGFIDLFNNIYCVGDGEPDFVTGDIQGAIGDVSQLIVTDFDSIIISLPDTLFFDVDEAGGGICRVWHLSSMDSIELDTGMHIDQINSMCFDLSTGAVFNRISNNGGEVSLPGGLTEIELCVSDSISDVLMFETTGNGVTYQYVITDTSNVIVALPDSASYDFEGSLAGVCRVWGLAHNSLFNSVVGDTLVLPDSPGSCFDLSDNFIEVIKEDSLGVCMGTECIVDGGFIDLFNNIYCVGDGEPDFVTGDIQGAIGDVSQLIVTDFDSIIISLPDTLFFDVDEAGGGICRVWHLSSMDSIELDTGMHIDQINSMCFDLSTGAVFNRISNNGGEVSLPGGLTEIELCVSDSVSDVLMFETTGNGVTYQYVITDTSNVIVALPDSASFDFEGSLAGVCRIWGLAHNSLFNSVVGDTLVLPDSPGSCFDLSDNFIEVIKEDSLGVCMAAECIVEGGFIDLFNSIYCVGDGESDFVLGEVFGAEGDVQQLIVTDSSGIILAISDTLLFDVDMFGAGTCFVYNISTMDSLNLSSGSHIDSIESSCIDISSPASFTKLNADGAFISFANNDTTTQVICIDDSIPDVLFVFRSLTTIPQYQYIVVDSNNVIISLPVDNEIEIDSLSTGICFIHGLSYSGVLLLEIGDTLFQEAPSSQCFDYSDNNLTVIKESCAMNLDAGNISLIDGTLQYCPGDSTGVLIPSMFDLFSFSSGFTVLTKSTDLDGDIYPDFVYGFSDIKWVEHNGINNNLSVTTIATPGFVGLIELGDVDQDDDVDILTSTFNNELVVLYNDGSNSFSSELIDNTFGSLNSSNTIYDIDDDGHNDILASSVMGAKALRYYINDGSGNFTMNSVVEGSAIYDSRVADVNDDGLSDVLYTTQEGTGDSLIIRLDITGNNQIMVIDPDLDGSPASSSESRINIIDFDLDGDTDLVLCVSRDAVYLYENVGGVFSKELLVNLLVYNENVDIMDYDDDGDYDLLTRQGIHYNDGNNNFTLFDLPLTNNNHIFSDVDADGVVDVISNNGEWLKASAGSYQFDINLIGQSPGSFAYVLTDENGIIQEIQSTPSPVALNLSPEGQYLLYHVVYNSISGLAIDESLGNLSGDFDISNSIELNSLPCSTDPELTIVLNRVGEASQIFDIKNVSSDTIDVEDYWICRGPGLYNRIGDVVIECGTFNLEMAPGDVLGLNIGIDNMDGELSIYTDNNFTNPGSIIHYVEWGSSGHVRSTVAQAAGLWSAGDFVPVFDELNSIYFDGEGISSSDWNEGNTNFCGEFSAPTSAIEFEMNPNPSVSEVRLNVSSTISEVNRIIIYDASGQIIMNKAVKLRSGESIDLDMTSAYGGIYYVQLRTKNGIKTEKLILLN